MLVPQVSKVVDVVDVVPDPGLWQLNLLQGLSHHVGNWARVLLSASAMGILG
jgi:hypothetical protein